MFYLWAVVLLSIAAGVVLLSFRQQSRREGVTRAPAMNRQATVAALYQDRLDELRGEMSGGMVASEDREVLEAELGAALLADVDSANDLGVISAAAATGQDAAATGQDAVATGQDATATEKTGVGPLAGASAALLLALSVLVYNQVGDPQAMVLSGAEVVFQLDPSKDTEALNEWRERLILRVDARPEDAKSWYLLGHAELRLASFSSAAEAFAMAHEAHGDDPSIDVFWLQSRYMAAGGVLDATSRTIADRVLAGNPNQPLVLEMYAIDAFRRESFQESVSLLNRALSNPLEGNHRHSLEAGFNQARERLGVLPGAVDVAIEVGVDVPRGMTLFVIARPVGGGMPFAVVRRPADAFPQTIRLDDAVSMNPAAPLSGAGEVEIVVRLSQSGTAMAHPGDWEWHSQPLTGTGGEAPLQLSARLIPPA